MAYHSDLWIVAGTAAPVVALSCIVLFGSQVTLVSKLEAERRSPRRKREFQEGSSRKTRTDRNSLINVPLQIPTAVTITAAGFNAIVFVLEAISLLSAFSSLAEGTDFLPPQFETIVQYLSLAFLVLATMFTTIARLMVEEPDIAKWIVDEPDTKLHGPDHGK